MDSNLTLLCLILLSLLSSIYILLFIYLIIFFSSFIITTYKLNRLILLSILVFLYFKIVAFNSIIVAILSGIISILIIL